MKEFKILIPLFNDWKSVTKLLYEIDLQLVKWNINVSVVIVNDASTEKKPDLNLNLNKIQSVKIINIKKNMSHQRCIATGLKHIFVNEKFDRIIVMDADGEDRPEELNDFLNKSLESPNKTITANRVKRSEGFLFRFLYQIHKLLTLVFTGKMIKFGNFSCITKEHVQQLIKQPHLWNAFSGSVVKTLNDRTSIPSIRGKRYILPSKMN